MEAHKNTPKDFSHSSYQELFKRNFPIIPELIQSKIQNLKVLVAGCGSTGGAFIEGASRLGVVNYVLVEPDTYDLNNLNRQFVYPSDLGLNKAVVHSKRLQNLFSSCGCHVVVDAAGIQTHNVSELLSNVDVVFDAVDVTTSSGMKAKLLLHEVAAQKKLLVLSALDLGFKQWIRVYDYRHSNQALDGRLEKAKACQNPLKALVEGFCPVDDFSYEIALEVYRLMQTPNSSACQLGSACHLLAAFVSPMLIRICENKSLPILTEFDVMRALETESERFEIENKRKLIQAELKSFFEKIP